MGLYFTHKVKSPHHIGMICKCNSRHIVFGRCGNQVLNFYGGLQDGELRMVVQVGKGCPLQGLLVLPDFCLAEARIGIQVFRGQFAR